MWIFPMGNTQTSIVLFGWGNSNGNSNQRKDRNMEDEKIKRMCEESANNFAIAFEELAKSIAETDKEFHSLMDSAIDSVMKQSIADAFIKEMKWLDKLVSSHWFTRWYYRMKYRKAKYARIQVERYYNQNFK